MPSQLAWSQNLARPGGNVSGVNFLTDELMPKRLELLLDLVSQAKVIALLVNPTNPKTEDVIKDVQEGAGAKGVLLPIVKPAPRGTSPGRRLRRTLRAPVS